MSSKSWSSLNRKKGLRKVSKKQSERLAEYVRAKEKYMEEHKLCEMCFAHGVLSWSTQLHHKKGRGVHIANPMYFSALCQNCHTTIHENPNWARETGWLIR